MTKSKKMPIKKNVYALYQGAVMCRLININFGKSAAVQFDNGEQATVPMTDLQMTFDLNPEG